MIRTKKGNFKKTLKRKLWIGGTNI